MHSQGMNWLDVYLESNAINLGKNVCQMIKNVNL